MSGLEIIFNCSEHGFGSIREYLIVADAFWGDNFSSMLRVAATEQQEQGPGSSTGLNENEPSACL